MSAAAVSPPRHRKRIALIAHDNQKSNLLDWARYNRGTLALHELHATGTTGSHPHDVDVKALLRIAVVYNAPIACNRATADFVLSSPLMNQEYSRAGNTLQAGG